MEDEAPTAVPLTSELRREAVGVTIITGYLGAGKSTLVNYVLSAQHGKRIAVILNEFGEELGVERAMINEGGRGTLVEEWVELPNGCVCCSVKHSFVQALEQLMQRRDRFDHILLETTGLANPGPVASVLWVDDQLESSVCLDSIVTVVDAKNLQRQLEDTSDGRTVTEAFLQIAYADVVILNKADLVAGDMLDDLKKDIESINALATVIDAVRCQVDIKKIMGCKVYHTKDSISLKTLEAKLRNYGETDVHDKKVRTVSFTEHSAVNLDKLNDWIANLLWEEHRDIEIYRMKAVLNVAGADEIHTLQAVRETYEIIPGRPWRTDETRLSKIVFIGKGVESDYLKKCFQCCFEK